MNRKMQHFTSREHLVKIKDYSKDRCKMYCLTKESMAETEVLDQTEVSNI